MSQRQGQADVRFTGTPMQIDQAIEWRTALSGDRIIRPHDVPEILRNQSRQRSVLDAQMQPAIGFARPELQFVEVFIIQETYDFVLRGLVEVLLKVAKDAATDGFPMKRNGCITRLNV
jgi:hypothetical protein